MTDLEPADGQFWRGIALAVGISLLVYGLAAFAFVRAAR